MNNSESNSVYTITTRSSSTFPGLGYHSGTLVRWLGSVVINGMNTIAPRTRLAPIDASSIFTITPRSSTSTLTTTGTFTSSSTAPGLGYLSGKVIHLVGSVVIDGMTVLRARLAQINSTLSRNRTASDSDAREIFSSELLELSRPVYDQAIRKRAFSMIMGQIGGLEFVDLAAGISKLHIYESYWVLEAMFSCFLQSQKNSPPESISEEALSHLVAGLEAYNARTQKNYPLTSTPILIPLLLFLCLAISLSPDAVFSQLLMELDIIGFINKTFDFREPVVDEISAELVGIVYCLLLQRLDPVKDVIAISELQKVEASHAEMAGASQIQIPRPNSEVSIFSEGLPVISTHSERGLVLITTRTVTALDRI
ncbi:hypothetical protein GYMLUDRAFT_100206 [Collybiopsis luxurians FD-317 M1]|uniref:Unplaced genomic scaffold GYMLUscaffold_72, whole genome shotgun sequence n=1 Tax=Collybiopsis luxurians FD-317 M1 TaxID=944289 RepID=A0A0D0CGL4_9AGAR|nr:hypothetical protein GYMLUDRAFT_100206 [Collybiopsis luxurians FD-317 M1]